MLDPTVGALERHRARISGQGETTLVYVHGYGCDQSVWREVIPAFEGHCRNVVFDLAGAGTRHPLVHDPRRHGALQGHVEDVLAVCSTLQGPRLVLVGHSVGAMIGALAAIQRPGLFAHLVMIGPSACYLNDGDYQGGFDRADLEDFLDLLQTNFQGWSGALAAMAMGNPDRPELAQSLSDRICSIDPAVAGIFARVTFLSDLRGEIPRLATPTTILACDEDPVSPATAIAFVHRAVRGSRLVALQATGHCPHISHPQEVVRALQDILDGGGMS